MCSYFPLVVSVLFYFKHAVLDRAHVLVVFVGEIRVPFLLPVGSRVVLYQCAISTHGFLAEIALFDEVEWSSYVSPLLQGSFAVLVIIVECGRVFTRLHNLSAESLWCRCPLNVVSVLGDEWLHVVKCYKVGWKGCLKYPLVCQLS